MRRRPLLQTIGATGTAAHVIGSASADAHGDPTQPNREEIPTGAHLGHLRAGGRSNADLIHQLDEAGIDSYEADTLDNAGAMRSAQASTGVYMSSAHVDIEGVESNPGGVASTYSQFSHDGRNPALVEPGIESGWDSQSSVESIAQRVNEAADLMADHGFEFGYHNGAREFQYLDGETRAYDVFVENVNDDVYLQLDVGAMYGAEDQPDPLQYLADYGHKFKSIHASNWSLDDEAFVEIHEGYVNIRAVATAARNVTNVDHLVYANPATSDPDRSIEHAAEWLDRVNSPWEPGGIPGIPGADTHPAKLG